MRHLVSCSGDESIRVWDLTTGNCLKVLHGHKDNVYSIKLNRFGAIFHLDPGPEGEFSLKMKKYFYLKIKKKRIR